MREEGVEGYERVGEERCKIVCVERCRGGSDTSWDFPAAVRGRPSHNRRRHINPVRATRSLP